MSRKASQRKRKQASSSPPTPSQPLSTLPSIYAFEMAYMDASASIIARCGSGVPYVPINSNRPMSRSGSLTGPLNTPALPISTHSQPRSQQHCQPQPTQNKKITVEDLSARLSDARRERYEQRIMKSACARGIWDELYTDDDGDLVMGGTVTPLLPTPGRAPRRQFDRNTPKNAFEYVNRYFLLGAVDHIPYEKNNENAMCDLLYDLSTFPLNMVIQRMKTDGFTVNG